MSKFVCKHLLLARGERKERSEREEGFKVEREKEGRREGNKSSDCKQMLSLFLSFSPFCESRCSESDKHQHNTNTFGISSATQFETRDSERKLERQLRKRSGVGSDQLPAQWNVIRLGSTITIPNISKLPTELPKVREKKASQDQHSDA